jgi:hypothetical protein
MVGHAPQGSRLGQDTAAKVLQAAKKKGRQGDETILNKQKKGVQYNKQASMQAGALATSRGVTRGKQHKMYREISAHPLHRRMK